MNREQIIADNSITKLCADRGIILKSNGKELVGLCPLHKEKTPSFTVNPDKRVWKCFGCNTGGSVIDLLMALERISIAEAMSRLGGDIKTPQMAVSAPKNPIQAIYSYRDELGTELYQVCRFDNPKTFRQRHEVNGAWVWNMEGVRRIPYNLPMLLKANAPFVWIAEGEKDADNLRSLGFVATTNVGGAGKWFDGYSDFLMGKEVIITGDNDEPGRAHVAKLVESLAKKAKTIRIIEIPAPHKDVSDYIQSIPDKELAAKKLYEMFESAPVLTGGILVPIQSMAELEKEYEQSLIEAKTSTLNLGHWLPSLRSSVRSLVPGELVCVLADTGVGKTAFLQNLAMHAAPVETLLFELELPGPLSFERFVAMSLSKPALDVMTHYNSGSIPPWRETSKLNHISVCSKSNLHPDEIEKIIVQSELKTGKQPRLVLLDYIGLVQSPGKSRYERLSTIAEQLKSIAKSTKTIIVIASQIHRKPDQDSPEIFLHDAKDSGSIENSSGLVIGLWRSGDSGQILHLKILKNTKGRSGLTIPCNFHGQSLLINERSKIDDQDIPPNPYPD